MPERRARATADLRTVLDRVRSALASGQVDQASKLLVGARGSIRGPIAARPTRVLLTLATRCKRKAGPKNASSLGKLWADDGAEELVVAGNDRRNRRLHEFARECYLEAL